ncbi:nuclear transport factor 2 family protein [Fodinibius sp. AD559]|uniref:nuclear transport factor 2 family protein n=1 Tax=Fodinibius sp. AD559 TaxID=3424179 RepID=UPI004046CBE7
MYDTKKGVSPGKHGINNAIKTILCIVVLSLLAIGCVQKESQQLSKEKEAAIADSIQTLAKDVNAAWENLDAESYMSYYSQDASLVYGGSMLSREELKNLVEKYMAGLEESTITMVDSKVNVLDSDAAVISL